MSDQRNTKQIIVGVIAIAALIMAGWTFFGSRGGNNEKQARKMHASGGRIIAQLAKQHLPNRSHLLLITPDYEKIPATQAGWMKEMEEACAAGLDTVKKESLAAVQSREQLAAHQKKIFTLDLCREIVKRHPGTTAIISLVGEPVLPRGEKIEKGDTLPPMVCFAPEASSVPELMSAGILAAAIVPRTSPTPYKEAANGDWFEIMYETVTPETVGAWAAAAHRHK